MKKAKENSEYCFHLYAYDKYADIALQKLALRAKKHSPEKMF